MANLDRDLPALKDGPKDGLLIERVMALVGLPEPRTRLRLNAGKSLFIFTSSGDQYTNAIFGGDHGRGVA
jgi:hypothetical protein